ncbi:MAG: DUF302 domain-containing protein [Anaerolineae bacterium]|nr:DUF302 domain-containing protein [Anaerolineae bacterium]MCO5189865.1 DUF302 domain-containing protein [Anaerolineae bacterium]MCO5191658.1 DUF302 domain-containing protein [Anaerolineae bacterium]MCO5207945.1 DUF302 domain-containing protein [Anaerolineae bacterium]
MTITKQALGMTVHLDTDFDTAEAQVRSALMAEGFGILTEIDVKATFKKKLDADFRPYKILGACNPPLAYRSLSAVPEVGMLLPCNVVVSQEENGRTLVSIIDPEMMLGVIDDPALAEVACDAKERLQRVVEELKGER